MSKSQIEFNPSLQLFSQHRVEAPLTVLSGGNNSGKSLTLKWLKRTLGRTAYYMGANRFYHVYHFSTGMRDPNELESYENAFHSQFNQEEYNHENNPMDLNRIIMGLSDTRRAQLFSLCGQLIGNTFSMKKVDEQNDLSPRYIDMDGQNISVGSTGTRLLMTILGVCMDDRFDTLLIDEPELGLSPRVQQALAAFFDNQEERRRYFPHLRRIYLATHSHLFLSRSDISSNYVCEKTGARITLRRISTISDFHNLQFNLLGNSLEGLHLPSAIVIVEGKTDFAYVKRVVELKFPGRNLTVVSGNGDVKKVLHSVRQTLGDINRSPYTSRLFVVVDSVHPRGLKEELVGLGVKEENVIIWGQNGIEYLYPLNVLKSIFNCGDDAIRTLNLDGDRITVNGITKTKNELKDDVLRRLTADAELPQEFQSKLLTPLQSAIF